MTVRRRSRRDGGRMTREMTMSNLDIYNPQKVRGIVEKLESRIDFLEHEIGSLRDVISKVMHERDSLRDELRATAIARHTHDTNCITELFSQCFRQDCLRVKELLK